VTGKRRARRELRPTARRVFDRSPQRIRSHLRPPQRPCDDCKDRRLPAIHLLRLKRYLAEESSLFRPRKPGEDSLRPPSRASRPWPLPLLPPGRIAPRLQRRQQIPIRHRQGLSLPLSRSAGGFANALSSPGARPRRRYCPWSPARPKHWDPGSPSAPAETPVGPHLLAAIFLQHAQREILRRHFLRKRGHRSQEPAYGSDCDRIADAIPAAPTAKPCHVECRRSRSPRARLARQPSWTGRSLHVLSSATSLRQRLPEWTLSSNAEYLEA
jgi:hypothetical protein